MKVFVIGRPGSGKTTAFRHIADMSENSGNKIIRIRDYTILHAMFEADTLHKKFQPADYGGFDVTDFSVLDYALRKIAHQMEELQKKEKDCLIMAEFARDDYKKALKLFSPSFLWDTHILFVDADMETCIQRIRNRVIHGKTADDHFVSDHILKTYYNRDNMPYMNKEAAYNANRRVVTSGVRNVVQVIDNRGNLSAFYEDVDKFIAEVQKQENAWKKQEAPSSKKLVGSSVVLSAKYKHVLNTKVEVAVRQKQLEKMSVGTVATPFYVYPHVFSEKLASKDVKFSASRKTTIIPVSKS